MSDIFLSYASSDRETARALGHRLEHEGWSVWWDRQIPPGKSYDDVIEQALVSARCIVVLWSKTSTISDWVKIEAEEGKQRGILVPALIEESRIPLAFRRIQAANIIGWQSSEKATEFDRFLHAIHAILGASLDHESAHLASEEQRHTSEASSERGDLNESSTPESTPQSEYYSFITRTYNAWLAGAMEKFSKNYKRDALIGGWLGFTTWIIAKCGRLIEAALRTGPFSDDEFCVNTYNNPAYSPYLLTNKRLFVFSKNDASGPITPIRLRDLRSYRFTRSFWNETLRIEFDMKNGESLIVKGLTSAPTVELINFLISLQ